MGREVIRGAFILAAGFALGYAKAMTELPEARTFFTELKDVMFEVKNAAETNTDDDNNTKGESPQ